MLYLAKAARGIRHISDPKQKTHPFGCVLCLGSGNDLLSRAVSSQVPSALKGLTSVFGMGTGGTLSPLSPEFSRVTLRTLKTAHPDFSHPARPVSFNFPFGLTCLNLLLDQVLDRLVSPSFKCYHSFTDDLSPGSLPGVLLLSNGTLILEVGFTLRCLQRLSRPHFASLLCRWHDNSCTSDAFTPVLSY